MRRAPKKVFICYSREDAEWRARLAVHLAQLVHDGEIEVFDDTQIAPGERWDPELRRGIAAAEVIVMLISADFFASTYITNVELPLALARSDVRIVPVNVGPSRFSESPLAELQAINTLDRTLISLSSAEQEAVLVATARAVREHVVARPVFPRRRAALFAISAGLAIGGLWWGGSYFSAPRWGSWVVEAELGERRFARGALLPIKVRADHDGHVWVFAIEGGIAALAWPHEDDEAAARNSTQAGAWRPIPLEGRDRYGISVGVEPGDQELIVIVTGSADRERALAHLAAMRPDLNIKVAKAIEAGGWGTTMVRYEVLP